MGILSKEFKIYKLKFSFAAFIWFLLAATGAVLKIRLGYDKIGNFLIYRNAFWHTIHQINLYTVYPLEKLGSYLYGPIFSLVIAPFALLPVWFGAFFWVLFNAASLFFAIRKLPVSCENQNIILLFSAIEMMTSIQNMQINCLIAALIIFSFTFIYNLRSIWAMLFIALGFLLKIYGIVGIVFLLFIKNKVKFIVAFLCWLIILVVLPMLISSPSFIFRSYVDWYHTLVVKNNINIHSDMQNISVMGMFSEIFKGQYLNLIIILIAALFYLFPIFRKHQLKNLNFQLSYLSFALIGVVIFSSSAESPTYIIAVVGVGLWFVLQEKKHWPVISLFLLVLIFTSLSSTDFFPKYIKVNFIQPYKLKALPCFLVWVILAYQLIKKDFKNSEIGYENENKESHSDISKLVD